jgi:glycosyltransferase involved in cell wall biosynthesis
MSPENSLPAQSTDNTINFSSAKKVSGIQHVAVLMGTYNGDQFLPEQLQSLLNQSYDNWALWVSDDGSQDRTRLQLQEFSRQTGRLKALKNGPRKGFARNFLSLVTDISIDADFYAFCDQDDIWYPNKLERAVQWLSTNPVTIPALYCSRSNLIDIQGNWLGESANYKCPPSFTNALVQCIAPGNTMVINRAARDILCMAGRDTDIPSHDWWAYIIVTGIGGLVNYDPALLLDYRQHGLNLVGANRGLKAQWVRMRKLLAGDFREWNTKHLNALRPLYHWLDPVNQAVLNEFYRIHHGGFFQRLQGYRSAGLYRQTLVGNIGLICGSLLGRI